MSDLLANDFRGTNPKTDPDGGSTSLNALAFSTLLSSQETDAHLDEILISRPGLISFVFLATVAVTSLIYPVSSFRSNRRFRSNRFPPLPFRSTVAIKYF